MGLLASARASVGGAEARLQRHCCAGSEPFGTTEVPSRYVQLRLRALLYNLGDEPFCITLNKSWLTEMMREKMADFGGAGADVSTLSCV